MVKNNTVGGWGNTISSLAGGFLAIAIGTSVLNEMANTIRTDGVVEVKEKSIKERMCDRLQKKQTFEEYVQERLSIEKMLK